MIEYRRTGGYGRGERKPREDERVYIYKKKPGVRREGGHYWNINHTII